MTVDIQASSHKLQWTMKTDCTILNQNVSNIKGNVWYDIQNSKVCHLLEDSRLQFFGKRKILFLWTSWLHKNSELWILRRLNAHLQWVTTTNKMSKVLPLHDNGGVHTSVHTTEAINKFLDGHVATFILQSWTCTIRLTPVWSHEKVPVKMPLSQQ